MTTDQAAGVAVGIDVGGTKLAAALVAADGSVLDAQRASTPKTSAGDILEVIVAAAEDLTARHHLDGIPVGVGAAGLIDRDGVVRYSPNLPWADFALRKEIGARVGGKVTVDNDANVAAYGEFRAGAGRDAGESMVMLTLGTGVGGGLILDDRLVRGAGGMAGELGHIAVTDSGPRCPCGAIGCLEAMASGTAIANAARLAQAEGRLAPDSALAALPAEEITGKEVTVAAHAGDPDAVALLSTAGQWLGVGIASLIAAFDPDMVVIGGGAMQAGELVLGPARQVAGQRLLGRGHRDLAPIVPASLGDQAGVVGAALLALAS